MLPDRVLIGQPLRLSAAVEAIHEGLDAMAECVCVLEKQRAVLLEGIGVREEHRFGPDDLTVERCQELLHRAAVCLVKRREALLEGGELGMPLCDKRLHLLRVRTMAG